MSKKLENICIDLHCDVPVDFIARREKGERAVFSKYHMKRFLEGQVDCFIGIVYVEPWFKPEKALRRGLEIMECVLDEVENTPGLVLVKDFTDFELLKDDSKVGMIIGVEGGELIEDSLDLLRIFYRLGVRCFGLVHGEPNLMADAGSFHNSKGGITEFGIKVIAELEAIGCIVDAAHLPSVGLDQLIKTAKKPFIISHTLPKGALGKGAHSDEQVRKIADTGSLIGITSTNEHPKGHPPGSIPTINEYVKCINYVRKIAGTVDCIGVGFDFDYFLDPAFLKKRYPDTVFEPVKGLEGPQKVKGLIPILRSEGYSEEEIGKIMGGNFIRLMKELWK